jgi:hypothetical protein
MQLKILPSSYGPIVEHEGMLIHLTDSEAMCAAIDTDPTLLRRLQADTLEFFVSVVEYSVEGFRDQRPIDRKLLTETVVALDNFYTLAHHHYRNYMENTVAKNNPQMLQEARLAETIRTNPKEINDFFRFVPRA